MKSWFGVVTACCFLVSTVSVRAEDGKLYERQIKPLLKNKCYACHGASKQEAGLRLDTARLIRQGGDSGPAIDLKKFSASLILQRVSSADADERMPPEGEPMTAEQIKLLRQWVAQGAPAPAKEQAQQDPRKHWAFQPLRPIEAPAGQGHEIDRFIRQGWRKAGIEGVGPASARVLIRRLFLDLHGLPPTAKQLDVWQKRLQPQAGGKEVGVNQQGLRQLVDTLLASPRYGERWAQHWLDVVRYADTHGFEVNTPRPNAWPFRDYVIRALNDDKPYNRFVYEQLVGDAVGEDAATGFLVAAAVLLPGQIGADAASKRLARQDSLDEMIVGTSATFLGLTVGCARCHDHKFDPISQRDYYAMQAFFAGVDYGDRPLRGADQRARSRRVAQIAPRIEELTRLLRGFEPSAFTGRMIVVDDEDAARVSSLMKKNGHGTNPAGSGRGYADDMGDARRLPNISRRRYTWWNNVKGKDTFTWNPATNGRFRLWISWGTHGSGVHTRDARYVLDIDGDLKTRGDQREIARADQYYFAGVSTGDSEKKPLWSGLHDAGVHEFRKETRLILRGGETGTGITADVIVLQETAAAEKSSILPRLRDPVRFNQNVERFAPRPARFVRFTSKATTNNNRYQPCLDELEVFAAANPSLNVALATRGVKLSSSGNLSETGKHQIKHINDGRYGNSFSWISNQLGKGWIQLEFPRVETINRIEWGRDREGKFKDRLPVSYQIDVSVDGETWTTVAGSGDRLALGTPTDRASSLLRSSRSMSSGSASSSGSTPLDLEKLLDEYARLTTLKAELEKPQMVYAGLFRKPDVTKLLRRGDPEQPLEQVAAGVPKILGDLQLPSGADEPSRRVALAKWVSSAGNPLTPRVMVNRVWQYHFGRGLVDTASDFGVNGARPSHPELLDWLANALIRNRWSLKELHRLILLSATYQQSNRVDPQAAEADADCRMLWRFPSRRLEAEAIRDGMLYVSGQLNLKMGGPGFDFFKSRGGLSGFPPVDKFSSEQLRRMVYAHKIRMERVPVFGAFDCPDAGQAMPRRSQSTTPIQALNLFNSSFVAEQAERFGARAAQAAPGAPDKQVQFLFRAALGRDPTSSESSATLPVVKQYGLATLARVLFNSNEFLFIP